MLGIHRGSYFLLLAAYLCLGRPSKAAGLKRNACLTKTIQLFHRLALWDSRLLGEAVVEQEQQQADFHNTACSVPSVRAQVFKRFYFQKDNGTLTQLEEADEARQKWRGQTKWLGSIQSEGRRWPLLARRDQFPLLEGDGLLGLGSGQ